jgi:hypothetical protein
MMASAEQQHRVIGRHRIQIVPRRMPLVVQPRLVVPPPDDPATWSPMFGRRIDQFDDLGDRPHRRRAQHQIVQRQSQHHRVRVRIIQPRRRRAPGQIDDLTSRCRSRACLRIRTDRNDHAIANRHRLSSWSRSIHRLDPAIEQEQISSHFVFLTLFPDRRSS